MTKHSRKSFLQLSTDLAKAKLDQSLARQKITQAQKDLRAATVEVETLTRRLHKLETQI